MKRLFLVAAITSLVATMASTSWAAANLNLSKSNINIVVSDEMTSAQTAALVAKLDRMPRVDEAAVKQGLQQLRIPTNFQLIRIIPGTPGKPTTVLLLMDRARANEAAAMATTVKGSKSNSDN
jgi:folylpolyglutamate synthase/dihydropteroate synthase